MNQEKIEPSGRIYRTACQYLTAADLLMNHSDHLIYPKIINYAFACELFLKSIETKTTYSKTKSNQHGHTLIQLFNRLGHQKKLLLEDSFKAITGKDLIHLLKKYSETFTKQRYHFEHMENPIINFSELSMLADGLKNTIPLLATPIEKPLNELSALVTAEIKSRRESSHLENGYSPTKSP